MEGRNQRGIDASRKTMGLGDPRTSIRSLPKDLSIAHIGLPRCGVPMKMTVLLLSHMSPYFMRLCAVVKA